MNKCRICLRTKPRRDISEINIFENGEKQSYKDIFMFCLGIQISENSTLSTKLCVRCYRRIILFYQFKTLAHKNDEFLRASAVWTDDEIKLEKELNKPPTTIVVTDEPLMIDVKDEIPFDFDDHNDDLSNDIKYEFKQEHNSDEEFLSVIKSLKEPELDVKENEPVKKRKRIKTNVTTSKLLSPMELLAKKKRNKGVYEGICEHCGKLYKDIRTHMRLQHSNKERVKVSCEHCDKLFASNILKRRHVQRKHFSVKQKCQLCDRSVSDLKMHMMNIHNKEALKFECVHCNRKFLTQSRLTQHISVHTKDRPFQCDQCNSCFRIKLSLTNHIRQVHDKERSHLCQFCSKSFFKKYHLALHLRSHTNEKPYQCTECGKYYQSTTSLRNHRLTHATEKTVSCTLCDATFISKSYLSNHMVSHRKEKRYPCKYCPVRFHRSDHRKRHEYTAHLQFTGEDVAVPRSYYVPKRKPQQKTPRDEAGESNTSSASSVLN